MKKLVISKLFLYRHRFVIGYIILSLAFVALLTLIPMLSPAGLSEAERQSAVASYQTTAASVADGGFIDLPYHVLQKYSIKLLGLTPYAVKLPSIILGLVLGLLLILLLNRWFKNNVALIASVLTVLTAPFLYLAGNGTPEICLVFWPTLLLLTGSKIQGKHRSRPVYSFIFAIFLLLSIFTPYMIYLAGFIFLYAMAHPHLRHTIKALPRIPFFIITFIVIACLSIMIFAVLKHPATATELLFMSDFSFSKFFANLATGFAPFFAWTGGANSQLLSPMISLAWFALAFTGLVSTAKGFFASRNSIASLIIVYTVLIAGFRPECAILIILPMAILTAHGIRYILEKWYGLFPENPYARIFAIFPIGLFLCIMIVTSTTHYIFGYRYNPTAADNYNTDLSLVRQQLQPGTTLLIQGGTTEYDFYKILENSIDIKVASSGDGVKAPVASLGRWANYPGSKIDRIITSPKSQNSDRIYIYK